MVFLASLVALHVQDGGKHLVRVPSSVPASFGLVVGSRNRFLATLSFPTISALGHHSVGKKSNSPNHDRKISRRHPRQHRLVVRVAAPMDIRHSLLPQRCQRDDLLAPILRIFLSTYHAQFYQAVDRPAERALVELQPISESLEVYTSKAIQLE
jgi:hypothetical protein